MNDYDSSSRREDGNSSSLVFFSRAKFIRKLVSFGIAMLLVSLSLSAAYAQTNPPLFFYPTEYRYADGHILNSPQTITAEQITTDFPAIPQMAGVVLILDWNTLCPSQEQCDFSLIDRVIDYWSRRKKKIVLDVATNGYPYRSPPDGKEIASATPQWVMRQVETYDVPRPRILGEKRHADANANVTVAFPDFRDPRFFALEASLVRELARRYNGNSAIAEVRIASGVLGEENPLVGPLSRPFLYGYHETDWIEYCRKLTALYKQSFTKTELEFDISRIPWVRAVGSLEEQEASDEFIDALLRQKVFLSFDGWESRDSDLLEHLNGASNNGLIYSLRYLTEYKRRGGRIGLEAVGNLANVRMGTRELENVKKLANVVSVLHPDRIVLFGDVAKMLYQNEARGKEYHAQKLLNSVITSP